MVHTNNLRYMEVYRGPIKGQIGLYKGQKGQISYLIEIAGVTHHYPCLHCAHSTVEKSGYFLGSSISQIQEIDISYEFRI